MTSHRQPLQADPDAVRRAADSLRDAVREHGPAALIPAAHGRLTTAVRCLTTTAEHLDPHQPATLHPLIEELRLTLAELHAYETIRAGLHTHRAASAPPTMTTADGDSTEAAPATQSTHDRVISDLGSILNRRREDGLHVATAFGWRRSILR
jgi:hypothetical protein